MVRRREAFILFYFIYLFIYLFIYFFGGGISPMDVMECLGGHRL